MNYPLFFNRGTKKTFLYTIRIFLRDIRALELERKKFDRRYIKNPVFENPNIFYSRAKHVEQMLILGIASEYLLKAVLLKHNFVINKSSVFKFSSKFSEKLEQLNESGYKTTGEQIKGVEKLSLENFNFKLQNDTLGFEECKQIFNKEIAGPKYFPNQEYLITNPETQEFYGKKLEYAKAWSVLQKIRNNYGHVPDSKYEENGILPFLYDFLIYVAKKEFPLVFKNVKKFKRRR